MAHQIVGHQKDSMIPTNNKVIVVYNFNVKKLSIERNLSTKTIESTASKIQLS
jgi:hypothetical protein